MIVNALYSYYLHDKYLDFKKVMFLLLNSFLDIEKNVLLCVLRAYFVAISCASHSSLRTSIHIWVFTETFLAWSIDNEPLIVMYSSYWYSKTNHENHAGRPSYNTIIPLASLWTRFVDCRWKRNIKTLMNRSATILTDCKTAKRYLLHEE